VQAAAGVGEGARRRRAEGEAAKYEVRGTSGRCGRDRLRRLEGASGRGATRGGRAKPFDSRSAAAVWRLRANGTGRGAAAALAYGTAVSVMALKF